MAVEREAIPPKIRHQNIRPHMGKFKTLWNEFTKDVMEEAKKQVADGNTPWRDVEVENLLAQRKELVNAAKRGMLERQDQEERIAFLSAVVWFLRLERARQDRILEVW